MIEKSNDGGLFLDRRERRGEILDERLRNPLLASGAGHSVGAQSAKFRESRYSVEELGQCSTSCAKNNKLSPAKPAFRGQRFQARTLPILKARRDFCNEHVAAADIRESVPDRAGRA